MEPSSVILLFTPFIVWAAVEVAQNLIPKITGTLTLVAVPLLTLLLNYLGHLAGADISWILQILVGLSAIFVDNLLNAIKGTPATAAKP